MQGRKMYYDADVRHVVNFIGIGIDWEPAGVGPGHFSTAIIELEDGHLESVPLDSVRFVKENE